MLQCKDCGVELTAENTYRRSGRKANFPTGYYRKCKNCYNKQRHQRCKANKDSIVERMGSKCQCCGYDKHPAALELHHLDPTKKDYGTTRRIRQITDKQRLESELSKCVLLCANCHRETHAGLHPEFMTV